MSMHLLRLAAPWDCARLFLLAAIQVSGWIPPSAWGTVLTFEPGLAFSAATKGMLPSGYGDAVIGADQGGFKYGSSGGFTPDIRLSGDTSRVLRDQPGNAASYGLEVLTGGWNHGSGESALRAMQPDAGGEQSIRLTFRGTDTRWPVLRGFDLVARGGQSSKVPVVSVGDGQLTSFYTTREIEVPGAGVQRFRFDPPLSAERLILVVSYGTAALPVGIDNIEYAQRSVTPEVWAAETLQIDEGLATGQKVLHPVGLAFDTAGRAVAGWTETSRSGAPGSGWWARREAEGWRVRRLSGAAAFGDFNLGGGLVLSTNDRPYFFHAAANFGNATPYFLTRIDLERTPEGPGEFLTLLPGLPGLRGTFAASGRASHPPDYVTHVDRDRLRLNGSVDLTTNAVLLGNAGQLAFRQGPHRQAHVLYPSDEGPIPQLRYNGGGPERDRAILPINVGSSPHSLAIDEANGIHVAAAQGAGRFFFGAVGELVYLNSPDGRTWTTNRFAAVPADVGATAIAVDSAGRPAIAFTRGFDSLYFTRWAGANWTAPTLVRSGLGGWDFSRGLQLAYGPGDIPHLVVADRTSRRLLVLSPSSVSLPTDLAVTGVWVTTNRVAVGAAVTWTLTVTNAGPRNALTSRVRVQWPPEVVVRDVNPRPAAIQGSEYVFETGTFFALESRAFTFTVTALDPVRVGVLASAESETTDAHPENDQRAFDVVDVVPAPCLADPGAPGCAEKIVRPAEVPPAMANEPWSLRFRAPGAASGSELRISASTPLPPGFCLTADGELRGVHGGAGRLPLVLDLVEPGGRTTSHARDIAVVEGGWPAGLVAFWPLDGDSKDTVGGMAAVVGDRASFMPGAVGWGIQAARDAINDPDVQLARPAELFVSPPLGGGAGIGAGPVTVIAWFRRDPGARSRGDARPYGFVLGLIQDDQWGRERFLVLDPASGRLDLIDGPPDFRANVVRGPFVGSDAWIHLGMVCDGPAVRLYTNGVLAAEGRFPQPLVERPRLSAGGAAMGGAFAGSIDELAVFQRALTASELTTLIASPIPRRTPLSPGTEFPIAPALRELVLPEAPLGEPYEATLVPAFCGNPDSVRLIGGALPAGLVLGSDGLIQGAASGVGTARFRVRAVDRGGWTADLPVQLTVRPGLPAFVQQPTDQSVEAGGLLVLIAETRGPADLQWYFNGRPLDGETNTLLAIPEFSTGQAGRYQVRAVNAAGVSWSLEVRAGVRTSPIRPPALEVVPVEVRPDGLVRLRFETLSGRVYELQRALDLRAALSGRWRTVRRFLATGGLDELTDLIPGRPGAAFYRIIEIPATPAAPNSVDDDRRYVGLGADGLPRPGLLPDRDPVTGRLGAFEFRPAGDEVPAGQGLQFRFPDGAQPVTREGAAALEFGRAELAFGEESPIQFDENGSNRLVIVAGPSTGLELNTGTVTVATLEQLLGRPAGTGIRVKVFGRFAFLLRRGSFDGPMLRGARLAWAEPEALPFPMPGESGDFPEFDLDLTGRRFRLPFHGEFTLGDGTKSPATLRIPEGRPAWVELRAGTEVTLGGIGEIAFAGGPVLNVAIFAEPPEYRMALRARGLRLPGRLSWSSLLPALPRRPGSPITARHGLPEPPGSVSDYYEKLEEAMAEQAKVMEEASFGSDATYLTPDVSQVPIDPPPAPAPVVPSATTAAPRKTFHNRDYREPDPIGAQLGVLPLWRGFVKNREGFGNLTADQQALVRRLVQKRVAQVQENAGDRGNPRSPREFELRVRLLDHVAAIAADADETETILISAARNAFDRLRRLEDETDCGAWDTESLQRALRALAGVQESIARRPALLPAFAGRDLTDWTRRLLVCRGDQFAADLGVRPGENRPDRNPKVLELPRYLAAERLQEALTLLKIGQTAGLTAPVVRPEAVSQLIFRIWQELRGKVVQATRGCDLGTWFYLTPELGEIVATYGEVLRTALGTNAEVDAIVREALDLMQLGPSFRDCFPSHDPASAAFRDEILAYAADRTLQQRFLLPALRTLRRNLLETPESLRLPLPAVQLNLEAVRVRFEALAGQNPALWVAANQVTTEDVADLLETGLLHDQLLLRLNPSATRIVLTANRMSGLTALVQAAARRDSNPYDLERAARVLLEAIRIQQRLESRAPSRAGPPVPLSREGEEWQASLLENLDHTVVELRRMVTAILDRQQSGSLADLLAAVDIQLPGGLSVEEAWGELSFDLARRSLRGALGGSLRIPGAGLALELRNAALSSGGHLDAEAFGTLDLPAGNPVASLQVFSHQPARLRWRPDRFELSGGGILRLPEGAEVSCFLSLADPVYQFSATARGLRLRLARGLTESIGLPVLERLPSGRLMQAIELLSRTGRLLDSGFAVESDPEAAPGSETSPDERPAPGDSDDLVAATLALDLYLADPENLGVSAAFPAARHGLSAPVAPSSSAGSNLLHHVAGQLERNAQRIGRDADELSQLDLALVADAASVPPAEVAVLRGPKLRLVAERLGTFGEDFKVTQTLLGLAKTRLLADAVGLDLEAATRGYFANYAACLGALRTNLLALGGAPASPWVRGPHWDAEAARLTQVACLRFVQLLQLAGGAIAEWSDPAQALFCDLARVFVDEQIEIHGLNPLSGHPSGEPTARARYDGLAAEDALRSARRLLELEVLAQQAGWCSPDARRASAVGALALRARNARALELREAASRIATRPWETPEAVLAAATNLLEIVLFPAQLGITEYPESAPRIQPTAASPDTRNPSVDLTDLVQEISGALAELLRLHDDVGSGYRAELDRRALAMRRVPLPGADQTASLIALFPETPGLPAMRSQLARLAGLEAAALVRAAERADFFARLRRHARELVRRAVELARVIEEAPGSSGLAGTGESRRHGEALVGQLTEGFVPRLTAALASSTDSPWWLSAGVAEELWAASERSWGGSAVPPALRAQANRSAVALRERVWSMRTRVAGPLDRFDLALPGDLEVQRLFGEIAFNRASRFVAVELGGRLEFPNIQTSPGQVAFFELERLRLESNGRFAFGASARVPVPITGVNASFTGRVTASGDWPHRALSLSGRGELAFATPPTNPETGLPFPRSVAATIAYEPVRLRPDGTPEGWQFRIGASGEFRRSFGVHLAVFGAGAGLTAGTDPEGRPFGGVTVGGSVGLLRKASRLAVEPPNLEDFELAVDGAGLEVFGTAGAGGFAAITNGTLRLPALFYPANLPPELACPGGGAGAPANGATLAIRDPIRLSYAVGGVPRLEGVVRFSRLGLRVPRAPFLSFVLCQADLGLDETGRPFLDVGQAGMQVDLPWDKGIFRLQNLHLGLDGEVRGQFLLSEDWDLLAAGGLRLTLPAASSVDPTVPAPAGCRGTALILEDVPGFAAPRIRINGGVRVEFPTSLITSLEGSRAGGLFCGGVTIEPTAGGPAVRAYVDELALTGDFRFGATGLALRRARIGAANFGGILSPNSEAPFLFRFEGDLEAGPFTFGMTNAQLRYLGPGRPPALALEGLRFAREVTKPMPPPLAFLPFAVDAAGIRFKDPFAALDRLLHPTNLVVTASGRVGFPSVTKAFVRGGVAGLEFSFDERGNVIAPAIDGFDLAVSAGAELKLPALGDLGGKIRIGGLRRALAEGPGHIYGVGEIGGTQQGYRLNFLGALILAGPIGLCLDVNFGSAGLTLSPTPFQITGASGGFAFLTTDNPCDFTQYFDFDPAQGSYRLRQTIKLPDVPIGMSWEQFAEVLERLASRVEAFAGNFDPGEIRPPNPGETGVAGRPEAGTDPVTMKEATVAWLADREAVEPTSTAPRTRSALAGGEGSGAFGCPADCPPRTVAILCQPHPDQVRFPDRVIFKFSSINESQLTNPPPTGLGLDRGTLGRWGTEAGGVGRNVAERMVASLRTAPGVSTLPPGMAAFLAEQERLALEGVRTVVSNLVAAAVRGSPDAYVAIREALYKGVPCPDLSLALAGRMSMVGLSAFGWVEGRQASSFSGSGGVVGELHVLGVPMGEVRAFISTTDANGLPNPSVCGQGTVSIGPLDLGRVDLAMQCDGCVTEMLGLFPTLAHGVGAPFLRGALNEFAPEYAALAGDPEALVAAVRRQPAGEQVRVILGLFNEIQSAGPGKLPGNLGELARDEIAATWDRIQPRLVFCGDLTPRLFGLPLTLGGRSVALSFLGEKSGVTGEFAFSPSSLVPIFPPGDEAAMSFAFRIRDPYTVLLASLDGRLNRLETREAFIREQAEHVLQNMVVAARYQWHPFGLELGDAAVRVLMPDLLDHPALPGRGWLNPDVEPAGGLPSRDVVLVQAAASGKLGAVYEWLGTTNDFAAIFAAGDSRGAAIRDRRVDLRRDYFPHGGIVGGARMALPRMLMVSVGEWQPLYQRAVHGTNLFDQIEAALRLLEDYVLRTETNGTAAFYTPAPNPPLLYGPDGRRLADDEIRRRLIARPEDFSPDGLIRQIRALDFSAPASLAHLYPDDLAFLRAEMTNLTLFGMRVFGTARLTGQPTPLRWVDGRPLGHWSVDIAGDSAIGKVAGGGLTLDFDLYATPEQNLAAWAKPLVDDLRRQRGGISTPGLAAGGGLAAKPSPLERFQAQIGRQLPRFAVTNSLPALSIVDLRNWAGGAAPTEIRPAEPGFGGGFGFGFGSVGGRGTPPPPATPVLRAELSFHAFSPLYEPGAPGEGPLAEARRQGGLAASGRLQILPDTPGRTGEGTAELGITVTGTQPRLLGRIRGLRLPTPFPGISLVNAQADFDSQAVTFLRAGTSVPVFDLGTLFRLESAVPGRPLEAAVSLSQSLPASGGGSGGGLGSFLRSYAVRAALELAPARLVSDRLGGQALVIHGAGGLTNPVVIRESGWSARASRVVAETEVAWHGAPTAGTGGLILRAPILGTLRDVVRVSGLPSGAFEVQGTRPSAFRARLDAALPGPLTIELYPGSTVPGLVQSTLSLNPPAGGRLQLEFGSDGRFLVAGQLGSTFNAGAPGVFAPGAEVRVDDDGVTIAGAIGTATGSWRVAVFEGRLEARFSGRLTLPRISSLGGRVILESPEGGDLEVTTEAGVTCVSGAVLTLRDFAPGAEPVRLAFPRFCLDASGGFGGMAPSAGLHALTEPDLSIGGFLLENLRSLRLSGRLGGASPSVRLEFESRLKLSTWLDVPIRGSVGTDGLQFAQNSSSLSVLGFDFSNLRLGATNALGDLPDIGMSGRLAALPAPLNALDFEGRIPAAGGFALLPGLAVDLPGLIPSFPLAGVRPAFQYRPEPYPSVARESGPVGYWRLQETEGAVVDSRLTRYGGSSAPRSGEASGGVTRGEPGAFAPESNRGARFDGGTGYIRFSSDALAVAGNGFAASLWFRRASAATRAAPRTLIARNGQWSLALRELSPGAGTRLQFGLAGPRQPGGTEALPLLGRTRLDDTDWHHAVAVYDGAAQYLYLDGRLDAWQPVRGSMAEVAGVPTTLGARLAPSGPVDAYNGWLDEVALYRRALRPVEVLAQGMAGGRGGISVAGDLFANAIPGLNARGFEGILSRDGEAVVALDPGGTSEWAGLRLPDFRATLFRMGTGSAAVFEAGLLAPGLDPSPLGSIRGVFDGTGAFQAEGIALGGRGVFGWDLRLTNLTAVGNWRMRSLTATVGARLALPYDLATLAVGGALDTVANTFLLRGAAGGSYSLGGRFPFDFSGQPELSRDQFRLDGNLRLGTAEGDARFGTRLEIARSGEVKADFSGLTPWTGFPGVGYGILDWTGRLTYTEGLPDLRFHGILGLAWPDHPKNLRELPEGLRTRLAGPTRLSLRMASQPFGVNARGRATVRAEPDFNGRSYFEFELLARPAPASWAGPGINSSAGLPLSD